MWMKKDLYYLLLMLMFPIGLIAQGTTNIKTLNTDIGSWINKHFAKKTVPPFSFVYNGKSSATFITKWEYSATKKEPGDTGVLHYEFNYREPGNGLLVTCDVKGFANFNAVEWVLRFKNNAPSQSGIIEQVKATDLNFVYEEGQVPDVHYADGSYASKEDFRPRLQRMNTDAELKMVPEEGRSSQKRFPFFNIAFTENTGVMVAIGWTGTWFASIQQKQPQQLSLATGMEHLRTYLNPGETIRTPGTAMLFWKGNNRFAGHNKFRRFILAHHTPKINGRIAQYPISNSFNYGDPAPCNEYTCMTTDYGVALIKRYRQFKLVSEVFWLDAGWYKHSGKAPQKNWANTVGNWSVDSTRFPGGLGEIADEAHKAGAKFMLWFEPERVMKNSDWANQHPEWMLNVSDAHGAFLFDLGNTEARKWLCETMGKLIEDNKVDYYRQDFNMQADIFWKNNDKPNREGITEIRYIEGLYAYWDYLLNRFPEMIIDNCASGGRRIDLETTSRSAPLWRTDYNYGEPVGYQSHTYGLELYLPQHGTGTHKTDKFSFRSSLGTSIVYNWKITQSGFNINEMQERQAEFKRVRPFFYEDYYPLTGTEETTADNIWLAYQLHRPSDDSSYIVAFRRENAVSDICVVKLQGLNPQKQYSITNEDAGETIQKSGAELSSGFILTLKERRSSLLLRIGAN